nr:MAG TPA: hypothetical protein [Caudoviricetes sp.]
MHHRGHVGRPYRIHFFSFCDTRQCCKDTVTMIIAMSCNNSVNVMK